ncbi:polysaccharide deacetylase family protein [Thiorhodococcus mannitoliphagus]|uniref:Polysaccharide deacetylase family protein n=1 Tax=Thiorhodococcus mannitoliphagus TaxID=329406 RepID=A0A6P1DPA4_9GAMM|nr:polysaccharide deacetylase family protein [Thiorhodococcus mannitoliphagus]NEX19390.1 polysaccharide deacetylase family protein [Thiorhodococcus mannitoliphagus]
MSPSGISILMYHQVGDFAPMKAHRANYCDRRRFAAQMGLLARLGYSVLTLDEVLACLRGEPVMPPRAVALTFDDAYENFADYALPVLEKHGFPATVYAISGWLGRRAEWFSKDPGRPIPNLMSGARLREMRAAGITVGSHTANHVKLGEVDLATKRREIRDSKAALEDVLGEAVDHLCYPFGSFDRETLHLAAEAGYRSATTCLRGAATPADHPLILPRKAISYGDNLLGVWWKLAMKHAPKPALAEWRRWALHDAKEAWQRRPDHADGQEQQEDRC